MKEIDIIKRLYDLRNDELYEDEDYEFIAFVKSFLEDKNISTERGNIMNIVCVVPSLDLKESNIYLKLKKILGDSLIKDITHRKLTMESETVKINFVTCNWHTQQISGVLIDIAIIADKNITKEWSDFLKMKTDINNGIILTLKERNAS